MELVVYGFVKLARAHLLMFDSLGDTPPVIEIIPSHCYGHLHANYINSLQKKNFLFHNEQPPN